MHECVNKYVRVSELQTQADSHTQIKPPPRHNYRRLKFHNNPLRGKQRERESENQTNIDTDTHTEGGRLGEKRPVKTREKQKRKRIIKPMEELFHSHHSNHVLKQPLWREWCVKRSERGTNVLPRIT